MAMARKSNPPAREGDAGRQRRVKRSITLDPDVLAGVEAAVGPRGVSAFINDAARLHLDNLRLRQLVADLIAEHGEPSPEARRAAGRIDLPW